MSYDDLERMLRNLYPRIAASLDLNAEWFGTREEATEARRARILHLLLLQATRGGA